MTTEAKKIIAIDYDGTIALNSFPHAGDPNWSVINRAKQEQLNGALLILWTCREGDDLNTALEACSKWGLSFDAVNDNPEHRQKFWNNNPRKIYADEYWDDHGVSVKYATWIEKVEKPEWLEDDVCIYYECSSCGINNFDTTPYCPCCGSKMENN